jgi:hypothetical protein
VTLSNPATSRSIRIDPVGTFRATPVIRVGIIPAALRMDDCYHRRSSNGHHDLRAQLLRSGSEARDFRAGRRRQGSRLRGSPSRGIELLIALPARHRPLRRSSLSAACRAADRAGAFRPIAGARCSRHQATSPADVAATAATGTPLQMAQSFRAAISRFMAAQGLHKNSGHRASRYAGKRRPRPSPPGVAAFPTTAQTLP